VLQIKWRTWPVGGTIIVRSHAEKIRIYLDNFTKDERDGVVLFFRENFADDVQENWSRFEKFTGRLSSQQKPASRGGILQFAVFLMGFAGVFAYCWFAGLGAQNLFIAMVNAVAGMWYLWRARLVKDDKLMAKAESHRE
jgi:hypothetical protein